MNNNGFYDGFAWAVPRGFRDALALCRFEEGDILYDSREAYSGTWQDGVRHITWQLQVKSPKSGYAVKRDKDQQSKFSDNWVQPAEFDLTSYKGGKSRRIIATQGTLYTIIWKGRIDVVDDVLPPSLPNPWANVMMDLSIASAYFRAASPKGAFLFIIPFDDTNELLRGKFNSVKSKLGSHIEHTVEIESLIKINYPNASEYVPTMQIGCFRIDSTDKENIHKHLKSALYTSTATGSATDKFKIEAHGQLLGANDVAIV